MITLPVEIQRLHDEGKQLEQETITLFDRFIADEIDDNTFTKERGIVTTEIRRWCNSLTIQVLPHTVYGKDFLLEILSRIEDTLRYGRSVTNFELEKESLSFQINRALSLIESLPTNFLSTPPIGRFQEIGNISNTAFIMMWMNPSLPELDDVSMQSRRSATASEFKLCALMTLNTKTR
jgi:hypothetical protein